MDAAGIQERRAVGTGRWEGHGCERGGNYKAALVLLNSCSQGTPLAGWGAPGIRFQQTPANEQRSSLRGAGSALLCGDGEAGGHPGRPIGKGRSRDEAGGGRGGLRVKSYMVAAAPGWRAGCRAPRAPRSTGQRTGPERC